MQPILRVVSSVLLYVLIVAIPLSIVMLIFQYSDNVNFWWSIVASEVGTFLFAGILATILDIAEDIRSAMRDNETPEWMKETGKSPVR